ncbi:unnamed protein product [Rotaria magnacalcarata]|uniref:Uncharacterized protein n=1 Tax=Rotaria magnacalcarata TaxID=392030 RepID=A0A816PM54_9BILA|nr:unnamed protein product [Rotaria magnacalcarata]CAF2087673.1 unnamed protein product [Rotaria magnacalcarata]CAF3870364.1 unnamed protein product [Rotaria magnacalcarata]CAF3926182.1 unnamed protein product [Rotaria magnacalcarata]
MDDLEIVYTLRKRINNLENKLKSLTRENVHNNVEINKKTVARISKIEARIIKLKGIQNYTIYQVYSSLTSRPRPLSNIFDMRMKIIEIDIEDNITKLKMGPCSFKLDDKKLALQDIIYPNDSTDRNLINILARYRKFIHKSKDFSQEKFQISHDSIETLIILLNDFIGQYEGELTFTNEYINYSNSLQYMICGIANLSNVHLIISNFIQTAIFSVKLNINYDRDLIRSNLTMKIFIYDFIKSISDVLHCNNDFIRIFSIERFDNKGSIIRVNFGLTTPDKNQTEILARHFQTLVRRSDFRNDKILRFIQSDRYRYELKCQLSYFQLSSKDFDLKSNSDPRKIDLLKENQSENCSSDIRDGWFRHEINLNNKYFDNQISFSYDNNNNDLWPFAYHGTYSILLKNIYEQINLSNKIKKDSIEIQIQIDNSSSSSFIYLTTNCNDAADDKCTKAIRISNGDNNQMFKLIFQFRVRPNSFTIHTDLMAHGPLWRIIDPLAIRSDGLLIKKEAYLQ